MWITRVWNPLFELPDSLQILQEKVRYYVTWGYELRGQLTFESPSSNNQILGEAREHTAGGRRNYFER